METENVSATSYNNDIFCHEKKLCKYVKLIIGSYNYPRKSSWFQ